MEFQYKRDLLVKFLWILTYIKLLDVPANTLWLHGPCLRYKLLSLFHLGHEDLANSETDSSYIVSTDRY